MRGVEFRKSLVFKGSGIPNKVFLDFFGEWNSENERFFSLFFPHI